MGNVDIKTRNVTAADLAVPVPKPPEPLEPTDDNRLEDIFSKMFQSSVSGTGEEELLRIASTYSRQIQA